MGSGTDDSRMEAAIKASDLQAALDLVASLSQAETPEALIEGALAGLLELTPALSVSWNELDLVEGRVNAIVRPDPGRDWYDEQRPVFSALMGQNPLVQHFDSTGDTRALTWEDVAPGVIQSTELYRRFYAPLGIESQLVMALPAPPGVILGVAVNRGPEGFSLRDRAVLACLRPHLVSAYRRALHLRQGRMLEAMVSRHGWHVLLVDSAGRIVGASGGDLDLAPDVLPLALKEVLSQTLSRFERTSIAAPSHPVTVNHSGTLLQAWVVPSEVGPHVVVVRPLVATPLAHLQKLGLSKRECEVAVALADGGSNQQIAERLGMAVGTLRKHLERVYALLEVDDRASAAARVRSLASD